MYMYVYIDVYVYVYLKGLVYVYVYLDGFVYLYGTCKMIYIGIWIGRRICIWSIDA